MDERHVGLIGATSLVGECLQKQLRQHHWRITAFSRYHNTRHNDQVTWRQFDTSAETPHCSHEKINYWICVAPIWVLPQHFNLLLTYGIKRIVILSSTSRFSKHDSSDRTEQHTAQLLMDSENQVQEWAANHEIDWIILRPTLIYGYGRDKNVSEIARFINRFGFFPLFGAAHGLRQPIHVNDVSFACFTTLNTLNLKNRSYNLTGKDTLTYREMVKKIFLALNRRPHIITVPLWIFRLVLLLLRWHPRYQHWTSAMAERMNQDLVFDSSEARKDFSFHPRLFKLTNKDLPNHI